MKESRQLLPEQKQELLKILKDRFEQNQHRHQDIDWTDVVKRLNAPSCEKKMWSLQEMESTGGEPDVVGLEKSTGEYIFCDCAAESPKGRRSLCYDRQGLESRKAHKPQNSALDMAAAMGIDLLTEQEYRDLQQLDSVDNKTSSWIQTPDRVRELGGALFCDRRYDRVFVYHNGAQSYYAARGFRGRLRV